MGILWTCVGSERFLLFCSLGSSLCIICLITAARCGNSMHAQQVDGHALTVTTPAHLHVYLQPRVRFVCWAYTEILASRAISGCAHTHSFGGLLMCGSVAVKTLIQLLWREQ